MEDVRKVVEKNLRAFKPGGGYVFCQVHNIQPGVPYDNLIAMYDTYNNLASINSGRDE